MRATLRRSCGWCRLAPNDTRHARAGTFKRQRFGHYRMGYDAKWTPDSAVYLGIDKCRFGLEKDEPELATTLKQLALASWTLFGFTGHRQSDPREPDPPNPVVSSTRGLSGRHRRT
jgi:hypothetical protein